MDPTDDSGDDLAEPNEDDTLDLPACFESIGSSCEQLRTIAKQLESYHIKLILCYGHIVEPKVESCQIVGNNYSQDVNQRKLPRQNITSGAGELKSVDSKQDTLAKLAQNKNILMSVSSLLKILPHLNDLSSIVEGCTTTLELTIKRLCYYLNDNHTLTSSRSERFCMTLDTKIYSIFITIMDLVYALTSLDHAIRSYTNIGRDLTTIISICQLTLDCQNSSQFDTGYELEDLKSLPRKNLVNLIEHLNSIKIVLICDPQKGSMFQNCLDEMHKLHIVLASNKTRSGFLSLRDHLEDFITFYCESQIDPTSGIKSRAENSANYKVATSKSLSLIAGKLVATEWMTSPSRRIFGISCIYVIYWRLFRTETKKLARIVAHLPLRYKVKNILPLIGSNHSLLLNQFLIQHLPEFAVDKKAMNQMNSQLEVEANCDDLRKQLEQHFIISLEWTTSLRAAAKSMSLSSISEETCYRLAVDHLERGVRLSREIRDHVIITMSSHLSRNKPISKNNLIPLYRSVTLVKSLGLEAESHRRLFGKVSAAMTNLFRIRWRILLTGVQKRLLSAKYSTRKLSADTVIIIANICIKPELISTANGRTLLSLSLSTLLPVLTSQELIEMNQLLELFSSIDNLYDSLKQNSDASYLYWNIPTFGTFYNHLFEDDPSPLNELKLFTMAINDIEGLFRISQVESCSSLVLAPRADIGWLQDRYREFMGKLADELMIQLKTDFLDKLCQEFEIELRVQTHRELCLDGQGSPFRRHMYNFKQIFKPVDNKITDRSFVLRFLDQEMNIRYYVEQHLSKVAYNLTAIAPVDWYTYDKMMNLARHKYQLKFANLQLPAQVLDSGLDLLDITRNLGLLASRYTYDFANQLFIEKSSNRSSAVSMSASTSESIQDIANMSTLSSYTASTSVNQSLNVIRTSHITRSIHTHGFGLLDSAVNQTYQIMKRLIKTFSKQMSDEKLAAVLRREHQQVCLYKQLHQTKQNTNPNAYNKQQIQSDYYPKSTTLVCYERVNKIAKSFKLNVTNLSEQQAQRNGQQGVDLDSIRQTITHLGNLLAFVRMLRCGALSCATKSTEYVPDLQAYLGDSFASSARLEFRFCNEQLLKAAENLDQCLSHLKSSLSPQSDYLSIITNLFSSLLKSADQQVDKTQAEAKNEPDSHSTGENLKPNPNQAQRERRDDLRLFFLLVPALTINYIEHLISCRERVTSRSSAVKFGALLSDDGFSMGIAFLLKVIGQIEEFQELDWLKMVCNRLNGNKRDVESRLGDSQYEEALRQTSSVTLRRLKRLETEYRALDYTLRSALLLFGSNQG